MKQRPFNWKCSERLINSKWSTVMTGVPRLIIHVLCACSKLLWLFYLLSVFVVVVAAVTVIVQYVNCSRRKSCQKRFRTLNAKEPNTVSTFKDKPGAHGVFTDRSIFILNLSRIQIPTGKLLTNCNHKHGVMLTSRSRHDVDMLT